MDMTTLRRVTCWLAGLAAMTPLVASAEWQANYDKGRKALANSDYRTAENTLIEALGEAEVFGKTDTRYLDTQAELGHLYRKTRQWAAAAEFYTEVTKALEATGQAKSAKAGNVYNKLGVVYHQMRDYDKAEPAYEASLAIKRRRYKQNITGIAVVESNLAELYRRRKNWTKSEKLLVDAVSDKERELGPTHPKLVPSLSNLGLVYFNLNTPDKATPHLDRAEKIARDFLASSPEDPEDVKTVGGDLGTVRHNQALVLQAASKNEAAAAAYAEAITLRETYLGPTHPLIATSLMNLGNVKTQLGKPAEAVPLFDRALDIRKTEYGRRSPQVANVLRRYLFTLEKLGDKAKLDAAKAWLAEITTTK